jgi:hypothetical protein
MNSRSGFVRVMAVCCPAFILMLNGLLPDVSEWTFLLAVCVFLVLFLGAVAYISFGLRCPRCSTWVIAEVPKCATCGLQHQATPSSRTTMSQN